MIEQAVGLGRPLKFSTVEELQEKIDQYFLMCETKQKPLTVTGLALALDTTRDVLIDYEERDVFSNAIKKAKQRIENYAEECLFSKDKNVAGVIFNMKNNWKWVDKIDLDADVKDQRTLCDLGVSKEDVLALAKQFKK